MKLELAKMIVDALEQNGDEAELRKDYSGRGMYGKTTAAIVTEASPILIGFLAAQSICDNEGEEGLFDFDTRDLPKQSDSMGLSKVYY